MSIFYIGESYSFIRSFIRGITSVTRNGLIVRARRAQEATYVISPTGKGSGKKGDGAYATAAMLFPRFFVAYRVYSPIRLAVSMETRGKTYRFSLWRLL